MSGDLFSGVERGQMNSGDEGKALSAMAPERDGSTSVVLESYARRRYGRTPTGTPMAC